MKIKINGEEFTTERVAFALEVSNTVRGQLEPIIKKFEDVISRGRKEGLSPEDIKTLFASKVIMFKLPIIISEEELIMIAFLPGAGLEAAMKNMQDICVQISGIIRDLARANISLAIAEKEAAEARKRDLI